MALASVEIPAVLVAPVRDSVVLLYQSAAEALHLALRAAPLPGRTERGGPLEEVQRQRSRLARLDALLVELGWWSEGTSKVPSGAVALQAPGDVLHDVLYGALIDAGERLAAACVEGWRGEAGTDSVRAAAMEVIALDRLAAEVRPRPAL
jgi:hypothetical protein